MKRLFERRLQRNLVLVIVSRIVFVRLCRVGILRLIVMILFTPDCPWGRWSRIDIMGLRLLSFWECKHLCFIFDSFSRNLFYLDMRRCNRCLRACYCHAAKNIIIVPRTHILRWLNIILLRVFHRGDERLLWVTWACWINWFLKHFLGSCFLFSFSVGKE